MTRDRGARRQLYRDALPFYRRDWPAGRLRATLRRFIPMLIEACLSTPWRDYLMAILDREYAPMMNLHAVLDAPVSCPASRMDDVPATLRSHVQNIATQFAQLPPASLPVYLGNYIESIVALAVGPDDVAPFLLRCVVYERD